MTLTRTPAELEELADAARWGLRPYIRCDRCERPHICKAQGDEWVCSSCLDTKSVKDYKDGRAIRGLNSLGG